jgi:hypothetical protein
MALLAFKALDSVPALFHNAGMAKHARIAPRPVTLETAAQDGKRLWLGCNGCGRNVFISVEEFTKIHRIPIEVPFKHVRMRLRCKECGSRDCLFTVESYNAPVTRKA